MWLPQPRSRIDSTQNASPAAMRFHLADTLNVARQNKQKANTRRMVVIMFFSLRLVWVYGFYLACASFIIWFGYRLAVVAALIGERRRTRLLKLESRTLRLPRRE